MKPWAIAVLLLAAVLAETVVARPSEGDDEGFQDDEASDDGEGGDLKPVGAPVLKTTPLMLTPKPGDTVTLPCVSENAPSIVWIVGTGPTAATLAIDNLRLTYKDDKRIAISPDHTLTIKDVQPKDSNDYVCKIAEGLTVVHSVKVYEPPRILRTVPEKSVILEKGEHVTLNCSATGFPEPRVSWTRKGRDLPGHKQEHVGDHIHYSHVDLRHTGTYVCRASNELGSEERAVYVAVSDGPEVQSVNMVNTKLGATAELECLVHAHPPAVVEWGFGNKILAADGHVQLLQDKQHELEGLGQRHLVRIAGVRSEDLGNYYCMAKNEKGTARRSVKLSGLPTPAKLEHVVYVQGRPVLQWTVESLEPVTKYEMLYRRAKPMSEWTAIELSSPAEELEGNVHKVKFELENVDATNYEARLKSRNKFGWSDMSEVYPFKAEPAQRAVLSRSREAGNGAPIERISFGLVLGAVAVLLART